MADNTKSGCHPTRMGKDTQKKTDGSNPGWMDKVRTNAPPKWAGRDSAVITPSQKWAKEKTIQLPAQVQKKKNN